MLKTKSVDPPPFLINDTPGFDPFDPANATATPTQPPGKTSKLATRLAFVGLLGVLAVAGTPGWGFFALGVGWLAVEQLL